MKFGYVYAFYMYFIVMYGHHPTLLCIWYLKNISALPLPYRRFKDRVRRFFVDTDQIPPPSPSAPCTNSVKLSRAPEQGWRGICSTSERERGASERVQSTVAKGPSVSICGASSSLCATDRKRVIYAATGVAPQKRYKINNVVAANI